jgi:glycosyltransferase involved in cell wall biosynthesis
LDLDDVPHIILSRKIKRMTAVKPRLGYALELLKTLCYEIKMLTRFDVTLVTSELDLYRLRRWNPTLQLRVVPNGVDTELFRFNEIGSRREQVIIFVGALDYEPNELAVKWLCTSIFPRIRRVIPRSRLLLVGHNPSRSVQSLAGPGIEIVGKVPDVRPYLRECSVSVVPITLGGGTRIKILEAAAAGRPVVSTSVGAEGLNLIPGREIEIADTEDDFVSKTVHLLSNPGKAAGMAKLARSRVERDYTWELSKRRLAEAISPWL